jgi:hypothetical protein
MASNQRGRLGPSRPRAIRRNAVAGVALTQPDNRRQRAGPRARIRAARRSSRLAALSSDGMPDAAINAAVAEPPSARSPDLQHTGRRT